MTILEPERIASMQSLLHSGDILFDIGAEKGTQSVIYAEMVGMSSLCLFEPEPTVWPNIRQAFDGADPPLRCYVGLVGNETTDPSGLDYPIEILDGWPACAYNEPTTTRTFRYIHEHARTTRQVRIDDWVFREQVVPKAVAIDVEGAEYLCLLGMCDTLLNHHPLIWCSIHPDLMLKNYNQSRDSLLDYMKRCGYTAELLAVDHEQHMLFR